MEIESDSVSLEEYRESAHAELLGAWLGEPHVVVGWGETSLENALEAGSRGGCRIIAVDDVPVGFVRWHALGRGELDAAGLDDVPEGGVDFDILIGETDFLQRGVGSRALRLAVELAERECEPPFFCVCTQVENDRAISCYRKAGFEIDRAFTEEGREFYFLKRAASPEKPSSGSARALLRIGAGIANKLADVVFPPVCVHCDGIVERIEKTDTAAETRPAHALRHVCARCAARIEFAAEPCCSTCGHPFYGELAGSRVCEHCEGLSPDFDEGRTAVLFRGAARDLIHALKYNGARFVLRDIEKILERSPRVIEFARGAVLVPVPLHPRKERERGYNQARFIAECMARAAGGMASNTQVEMLLRRVVDTVSQTALDRATRRKNLRKAFALAPGARVDAARKYVLVDDVFTTGSTLNSCAGVLRRAGCAHVGVLTFGHG